MTFLILELNVKCIMLRYVLVSNSLIRKLFKVSCFIPSHGKLFSNNFELCHD